MALKIFATGLNIGEGEADGEGEDVWRNVCRTWPGTRIPSVQRSTHVKGKLGMSMPQSSTLFLNCVLKLKW
jgi:hypothetical protein